MITANFSGPNIINKGAGERELGRKEKEREREKKRKRGKERKEKEREREEGERRVGLKKRAQIENSS